MVMKNMVRARSFLRYRVFFKKVLHKLWFFPLLELCIIIDATAEFYCITATAITVLIAMFRKAGSAGFTCNKYFSLNVKENERKNKDDLAER